MLRVRFPSPKLVRHALALATIMAVTAASAWAHDPIHLSGAEEVPAVQTAAKGVARIHIDPDRSVKGHVETTGLEGTAAHVHLGERGKNGPPVITLAQGDAGRWHIPEGTVLSEEHYAAYRAGHLYVNVHSAAHKPGEIRAQIVPE